MKDIAPLLATVFVLFSLIGLLSADYNRDSTAWRLQHTGEEHLQAGWLPVLATIAGAQHRIGGAARTTKAARR